MPDAAPPPAAATPEAEEFFGTGLAVEIPKIPRELKKLWQENEGVAMRASRLNLVIYSAAQHSLRANTALVETITREHALRAIVVAAKKNAAEADGPPVRAWINAHCQMSKTGAKQRCSEQIAFQLQGEAAAGNDTLLQSLIFSHLDSDLPLYLWWQGDLPAQPDPQLMTWVDRLIIHSGDWQRPREGFTALRDLADFSRLRTSLSDLNWTPLANLRAAVAGFFDNPATGPRDLAGIDQVEIEHAPGFRLRALLVLGWLGVRLGWKLPTVNAFTTDEFTLGGAGEGLSVAATLRETAGDGAPIRKVLLRTRDGAEFSVTRQAGSDFYNTYSRRSSGETPRGQVLHAGSNDPAALVSEELLHSGHHRAYLRVIDAVEPMLG